MSRPEEHKRLVRSFFDALNRSDAATLHSLMQPDMRWVVPDGAIMMGGLHEGAETVIERMTSAVGETFVPGSNQTRIRAMLAEENVVMAETRLTATHLDGRRYDNCYVFVFEFRDGRVAELREHVDTAYAAAFFGT
ncbi:nuclear transport factor 2 family protein [Myxococcota bacterium]|nr:nuclear transport factor 2 family protein [Myxococcota bacterium]